MTIKETVRAELVTAMKAKEQVKVDTLRGIIAAFTNDLVAKGRKPTEELNDAESIAVIKKLAKQRKEAVELYTTGGRPELAAKESSELAILEAYLPAGASREEIEKVAKAKQTELGVTDASGSGKLMGAIIKEFGGNADGAVVKEVVATLFS